MPAAGVMVRHIRRLASESLQGRKPRVREREVRRSPWSRKKAKIFDLARPLVGRTTMAAKQPSWEDRVRRLLKAELARTEIGYRELAERLKKQGLEETEARIANKIGRGTFPATFLVASLKALEVDVLRLEAV
jgi:hypothetical protein